MDTHRTPENALRGVTGFNALEDRRHDRRTVSLAEMRKLIEAADRGPDVMGVSGHSRALCCRLSVASGLRYSEIASIRPESFDWTARSVTVAAAYTKNGDPATLPVPSDLANDLAAYVAPLPSGTPIFPLPPEKGAKFDPGIDRPLYPAPRRGHRGRRRQDPKSQARGEQARGHGRERDRGEAWTHKQTLCPFFAPRR